MKTKLLEIFAKGYQFGYACNTYDEVVKEVLTYETDNEVSEDEMTEYARGVSCGFTDREYDLIEIGLGNVVLH